MFKPPFVRKGKAVFLMGSSRISYRLSLKFKVKIYEDRPSCKIVLLYNAYANLEFFARIKIVGFVPESNLSRWAKILGLADAI